MQDFCDMLLCVIRDPDEHDGVLVPAVCALMTATAWPGSLKFVGGLCSYASALLALMQRSLARGDAAGRGVALHVLGACARALAQVSGCTDGKMALVKLRAAPALLAVLATEIKVRSAALRKRLDCVEAALVGDVHAAAVHALCMRPLVHV